MPRVRIDPNGISSLWLNTLEVNGHSNEYKMHESKCDAAERRGDSGIIRSQRIWVVWFVEI